MSFYVISCIFEKIKFWSKMSRFLTRTPSPLHLGLGGPQDLLKNVRCKSKIDFFQQCLKWLKLIEKHVFYCFVYHFIRFYAFLKHFWAISARFHAYLKHYFRLFRFFHFLRFFSKYLETGCKNMDPHEFHGGKVA